MAFLLEFSTKILYTYLISQCVLHVLHVTLYFFNNTNLTKNVYKYVYTYIFITGGGPLGWGLGEGLTATRRN
jgi:hypothetical protein